MLNAAAAYKHLIAGQNKPGQAASTGWDINNLDGKQTPENIYKITIAEPAGKFITATAVWNKHYESVYPFSPIPEKDADLRLEIWAVDPNNSDNDYLLDYSDSNVDNVEHIYCRADANYSNYEIVLSYSEPNQPRQRYGLAWNVSKKQDTDSALWYDLNADGIVNEQDLTILLNNWLANIKSSDGYLLGDINADGTIDKKDFEIILKHTNR